VTIEQFKSQLSALPPSPRIIASGNSAYPAAAMAIVDETLASYRIYALNAPPGIPDRDGVLVETSFVGPGMRKLDNLRYVPARLSLVPRVFATALPPDLVLLHCAPARDGKVSMGIEVNILPGAIDACRSRGGLVVAVVNPNMPYTFGDAEIELDDIDFVLEMEAPLSRPGTAVQDEASTEIGQRVAAVVEDGSTLQMGIGAVPDATLEGLTDRRGLRIWSEMFSDGVVRLAEAGALEPDYPITATFCFGTPEMYTWLDGNPRVRLMRTEKVNNPVKIASQPLMTSVNTALQVDLFAQANASRINARIFSGFGGQTDFIVGALHSSGGKSLIALRSWHPRADVSTIVPLLDEPVTSFQQTAIVTEQGMAQIFGNDQRTQARNIIERAAHPNVREELWEEAYHLGLT
jgi:acyl-CoA hydrolase